MLTAAVIDEGTLSQAATVGKQFAGPWTGTAWPPLTASSANPA